MRAPTVNFRSEYPEKTCPSQSLPFARSHIIEFVSLHAGASWHAQDKIVTILVLQSPECCYKAYSTGHIVNPAADHDAGIYDGGLR